MPKEKQPKIPSEAATQKKIRDFLKPHVTDVWRMNSGIMRVGGNIIKLLPAGTPDLMVLFDGGFVMFIEVKKTTPHTFTSFQKGMLKTLQLNGFVTLIATNENWKRVCQKVVDTQIKIRSTTESRNPIGMTSFTG